MTKEEMRAYQKQWRKDHPDYLKNYLKTWRQENPDYSKTYYRNLKAAAKAGSQSEL